MSDATTLTNRVNKKAEQRQASIDLLLQAALSSFVSQGYHSTNLEQIAATAHLTKGAVYFYFGSKEAVLLELLKRVQTVVVDEAIRVVEATRGSFADRLVAYIHYQAGLGLTHRDEVLLLILMSLEFKERQGKVHSFIQKLNKRQCNFVESLIEAGQAQGECRTDLRAREIGAIIRALNDGTFLEWFRRSSTLKGPELVRALRAAALGVTQAPVSRADQGKPRA